MDNYYLRNFEIKVLKEKESIGRLLHQLKIIFVLFKKFKIKPDILLLFLKPLDIYKNTLTGRKYGY